MLKILNIKLDFLNAFVHVQIPKIQELYKKRLELWVISKKINYMTSR